MTELHSVLLVGQFSSSLFDDGVQRYTPIKANEASRIYDGHHGTRAAIDSGTTVDVKVVAGNDPPAPAPAVKDMPILGK